VVRARLHAGGGAGLGGAHGGAPDNTGSGRRGWGDRGRAGRIGRGRKAACVPGPRSSPRFGPGGYPSVPQANGPGPA